MFKATKINRFKTLVSLLLILVITFFAFYPSLNNDFTNWDDDKYVTENPVIQSLSLLNLRKIFTSLFLGNYQPVTIISYLIEYRLFKLNPFGYHLTNLILHLLNCLLVFWLMFFLTGKVSISWVTAILFGVHPLQVESVAWISERKNVLYAFFFLGAMLSYLYYLREKNKLKYYYLSLCLFILSLLSKSMAVTLPLVMFLMDYILCRKPDKNMFVEKVPFFILSCIFGTIAIFGISSSGTIRQENYYSLLSIFAVASYDIVFYLYKIFLPFRLSCFYPYDGMQNFTVYLYSIVTMVILFISGIISGKHTKKVIFGSLFFLLTILPVLQFVPYGSIIVADRYIYISAIGIFYILTEGLFWLYRRWEKHIRSIGGLILMSCLIIFLSLLNFKRSAIWRDSITLWSDVLRNYPKVSVAYNNRGFAYYNKGDIDQAFFDYNKAIEIDPRYARAYRNRGVAYYDKGNIDLSISDYNRTIEINHNYADAYYNRGSAYSIKGDIGRAISDYSKSIELNPDFASAYNNRAILYYLNKEYDKAWEDISKAKILGYKVYPGFIEKLENVSITNNSDTFSQTTDAFQSNQ